MRSFYLYKQSFLRLLLFKFVMHSTQSNKIHVQNKTKPRRINSIIVVNYLERHLSVIFLCPPCAYLNVRRCLNTCPYRMFKIFIFRFLQKYLINRN